MGKTKSVFLGIVFCVVLSSALNAQWTTRRLTVNAGYSAYPAVATSWPNIYVAWSDNTSGESQIYLKQSADGGATWLAAKKITDLSHSSHPDIAIYQKNIYVVWQEILPDEDKTEVFFMKSPDKGATWTDPLRLTHSIESSFLPRIAKNGANVYVVWSEHIDNYSPGNYEIFFRKSTDGGETWQAKKRLTHISGISNSPVIVVDSSDNIFIIWYDNTLGLYELFFKKSTDGGATWQSAQRLTYYDPKNNVEPAIAVNGANIYVTWSRENWEGNKEIYFIGSFDGGATWAANKKLTSNLGYSRYPAIAVGQANEIYIVWQDDARGNFEVYFMMSMDGGATWQNAQRLTYNSGKSYEPRIKFAVNGSAIFVVWYDDTPGNYEIYLKCLTLL